MRERVARKSHLPHGLQAQAQLDELRMDNTLYHVIHVAVAQLISSSSVPCYNKCLVWPVVPTKQSAFPVTGTQSGLFTRALASSTLGGSKTLRLAAAWEPQSSTRGSGLRKVDSGSGMLPYWLSHDVSISLKYV